MGLSLAEKVTNNALLTGGSSPVQIASMSHDITADLEQLGRDAAQHVAGEEAVQEVEVMAGEESERPVYYFSFLIDQDRARQRAGLLRSRLIQELRDGLIARNDGHYPIIRILSRADWDKRASA